MPIPAHVQRALDRRTYGGRGRGFSLPYISSGTSDRELHDHLEDRGLLKFSLQGTPFYTERPELLDDEEPHACNQECPEGIHMSRCDWDEKCAFYGLFKGSCCHYAMRAQCPHMEKHRLAKTDEEKKLHPKCPWAHILYCDHVAGRRVRKNQPVFYCPPEKAHRPALHPDAYSQYLVKSLDFRDQKQERDAKFEEKRLAMEREEAARQDDEEDLRFQREVLADYRKNASKQIKEAAGKDYEANADAMMSRSKKFRSVIKETRQDVESNALDHKKIRENAKHAREARWRKNRASFFEKKRAEVRDRQQAEEESAAASDGDAADDGWGDNRQPERQNGEVEAHDLEDFL